MRDENVCIFWNCFMPWMAGRVVLKRVGRGGATRPDDIGRTIDIQTSLAFECQGFRLALEIRDAFELDAVLEAGVFISSCFNIEEDVVVPANHNLVCVRKRVEPVNLRLYLRRGASLGQVAGVDQEVSRRDIWYSHAMRVRQTDHFDRRPAAWWLHGTATQPEKKAVEPNDKSLQRRFEVLIQQGRLVPMARPPKP